MSVRFPEQLHSPMKKYLEKTKNIHEHDLNKRYSTYGKNYKGI